MKVVTIQDAKIESCIEDAQGEGVVITKDGEPVAVVLGAGGMDLEQLELCRSAGFWALIKERRARPTISRKELEKRLSQK
jgi:antitoxin (DNA-binding transcriptional repressor) of toxin-antitoxin stability system